MLNLSNKIPLTPFAKGGIMKNEEIHVQVIGVGGGGGKAVNHIAELNKERAQFIIVDTDQTTLNKSDVEEKILIGQHLTNDYDSATNPNIGKKAAEEDYEKICGLVANADIVFLSAGLGGRTGTDATPIIAKAAKAAEAMVIAVVTLPFINEGSKRRTVAKSGLNELEQIVDFVICIPNDKITKFAGSGMTINEAFRLSDKVLNDAFTALVSLIDEVSVKNINYNDIITVLKNVYF